MEILQGEMRRVPAKNIVLGGLSQGCATSMAVLLCLEHPLGGYVGMSGFLTFQSDLELAIADDDQDNDLDDPFFREGPASETRGAVVKAQAFERDLLGLNSLEDPKKEDTAYSTPVFLGHGAEDEKVPCSLGVQMAEVIKSAQYQVEFKCYEEQGHWYKIPGEIDDIVHFLHHKVQWELERHEEEAL